MLAECPHATFFHSRAWAEIWQQYNGLIARSKKIEFSDDRALILPCSYYPAMKGMVKNVVMSPAGTYGGPLYQSGITPEHTQLAIAKVEKFPLVTWRQNPFEPLSKNDWPVNSTYDFTQALDIPDGFDEVYKNWTKGHRSAAKKARREGITVRQATSLKDWQAYYEAYMDSQDRWGEKATSRYGWQLFDIFYQAGSSNIKLWIAELDNQLTAGAICFYQNNHVVYWHGAAHAAWFHLRPVHLLLYEVIKDACDKSYQWFDFNPSGGHDGVVSFKKSFGCKNYPSQLYIFQHMAVRLFQKFKNLYK